MISSHCGVKLARPRGRQPKGIIRRVCCVCGRVFDQKMRDKEAEDTAKMTELLLKSRLKKNPQFLDE